MSHPPPQVGSRVFGGRYVVQREIGQGATARVFVASDNASGRTVALKVLRPELAESSAAGDRFLREIRLTQGLHHSHILPVIDCGNIDDQLYFALPYMEGGTLRDRLRQEKQLSLADAVRITATIADALDYAHQQGLIHRDVKPGNILFTSGEACLGDFGIARALERALDPDGVSTSTGVIRGTVAYMSPEQATGSRHYDGRSDIFSLGCVLYEMLTGMPAFIGATAEETLAQRFKHPPRDIRVYRPQVPQALQAAVTKATAFTPADRFTSAGEMARALLAIDLSEISTEPFVEPISIEQTLSRHRRLMFSWGASALALVAAAVVGWASLRDRGAVATPASDELRLAVLYFDSPASDTMLRRVADGLTEELIYELGGVNAFRVVSRSGVRPYRARATPLDSIVSALGVSTLIEGSLSRLPDSVRVVVHVVDARTKTYVDSVSVQESLGDETALAGTVAQRVAAVLRPRLGRPIRLRQATAGTSSRSARDLVLKSERLRDDAERLAQEPHANDVRAALAAYDRADSLLRLAQREDQKWPRPLIERAWTAFASVELLPNAARAAATRRGIAFADSALALAPNSAEALEVRGTLRWMPVTESSGSPTDSAAMRLAEEDLRAALDRDSTLAGAWATLSWILWTKGSHGDAALAAERALREDPYLSRVRSVFDNLFYDALMLGEMRQADAWCRRGHLAAPNAYQFVQCQLTLLRHDQAAPADTQKAWALVRELERIDPASKATAVGRGYQPIYRRLVAAAISARAGDTLRAERELAWARRQVAGDTAKQLDLAYDEAYLRLVLGDREQAVLMLRRLIKARPLLKPLIARDPLFRSLPRF